MKTHFIRLLKPIVERAPRLAMTWRYLRDNWQLYDEPKDTRLGFKLVGNPLMQNGQYEPEETQIAKQLIPQVDVVINIGANIGYYCCLSLCIGKPVVAFEPMEANLRYLLRNIKANHWESQIEVYPVALSNQTGVLELHGGGPQASLVKGWGGRQQQYVTLVPTSTLDTVLGLRFQSKRCFMLVDIEGAELAMLQGGSCFIDMNPKPIWMMEISIAEHQPQGITLNPNLLSTFRFFWNKGYEAWTTDHPSRIIYPEEIEGIVQSGSDPFRTHNFLFIENGKRHELFDV